MINLTRKQRYGVAVMLDIALHQSQGAVSTLSIAKRQALSASYIEQIIISLRRAGLVHSTRGPGGYQICRDLEDITVLSIIRALESEPTDIILTPTKNKIQQLWTDLKIQTTEFLGTITLHMIIQSSNKEHSLPKKEQIL